MKKIAFHTLGCKLNQYETEAIAGDFLRAGYEVVPFESPADAYVINSCTVTNKADRKSRNILGKATRSSGDPVIVLTGCFADSAKEELEKKEGITYLVENSKKSHIFSLVDGHFKGELLHPDDMERDFFSFSPPDQGVFHTRSMVKIQDGCDNFCTFCIIPFVRGRAKSRPLEEILENIKTLIQSGTKEIVLTGVNMARYQWEGIGFQELLFHILDLPGDWRLRISSLEPEGLDHRFIEAMSHPRMCPHLHLCIQSASPKILLQMRREYSLEEYMGLIEDLRALDPHFNITTDILYAFPGEDKEDLEMTIKSIQNIGFGHVHLFPYSKRKGTRAERMENQIPELEKKRRGNILHLVGLEAKKAFRSRFIGKTQKVLIESLDEEWASGYGEHYLPVKIQNNGLIQNTFVEVELMTLEGGEDPFFYGRVLCQSPSSETRRA